MALGSGRNLIETIAAVGLAQIEGVQLAILTGS